MTLEGRGGPPKLRADFENLVIYFVELTIPNILYGCKREKTDKKRRSKKDEGDEKSFPELALSLSVCII